MQDSKTEDFDHPIENDWDFYVGANTRPRIPITHGDIAVPIKDETADRGVCERTLRPMNMPMMNSGGITCVADRGILIYGRKGLKRGHR
jgi:hypothetical protein